MFYTEHTARMESVAAAQTRLHFQFFGMTAGLHDAKQMHDSCMPSIGRAEWII